MDNVMIESCIDYSPSSTEKRTPFWLAKAKSIAKFNNAFFPNNTRGTSNSSLTEIFFQLLKTSMGKPLNNQT